MCGGGGGGSGGVFIAFPRHRKKKKCVTITKHLCVFLGYILTILGHFFLSCSFSEICPYFLPGRGCKNGNTCRLLHAVPLVTSNPSQLERKRRVCQFFVSPGCRNGNSCSFLHEQSSKHDNVRSQRQEDTSLASSLPRKRKQSDTVCRYFISSTCRKGSLCSFLHTQKSEDMHVRTNEIGKCSAVLQPPVKRRRTDSVCKFFVTPGCRNGDMC